jgi:DNA modification methylase
VNTIVNDRFQEALKTLPDDSVQLCFTSPPYEDMITYRDKDGSVVSRGGQKEAFIEEFWIDLFDTLRGPMRDDGCVCIVINDKRRDGAVSTTNYEGMVRVTQNGWHLIEHVPWLKTAGIPKDPARLQDWWEHIFIFCKTTKPKFHADRIRGRYSPASIDRYAWGGGIVRKIGKMTNRNLSRYDDTLTTAKDTKGEQHRVVKLDPRGKLLPNVLIVSPDVGRKTPHPARFPLALARWAITLCTDPGDLVIDPMAGSCTTLISAKTMCRKWWGSDMGEDYVTMGMKELDRTLEQPSFVEDEYSVPVASDETLAQLTIFPEEVEDGDDDSGNGGPDL